MGLRLLLLTSLLSACATTSSSRQATAAPRRGFPEACGKRPALQFVKLGSAPNAVEKKWAQDFAAAYGLPSSWGETTALPPAVTTSQGSQQVAEELIAALDRRKSKPAPSTVVVGLTEQDLFIRGKTEWYWAFGLYVGQTVVISTARMEPASAELSQRLSKHLARVLGSIVCGLPRSGPPHSEMRREVGGLGDLDEIEESNWELEAEAVATSGALDQQSLEDQLIQVQELVRQKDPRGAIVITQQIISQYEAAYRDSGKLVFCAQNLEQTLVYSALAVAQQRESVVLDPIWALAWFYKGFALAELKRYPEAELALQGALKLSPRNSNFLSELGFVQQSQHRALDAIKTFELALTAAGLSDEAAQNEHRARAKRGIGFNQIELGDLDGAEKSFKEALKLDPADTGAVRELRYIDEQRRKGAVQPL